METAVTTNTMTSLVFKPLKFSSCHGRNIVLGQDRAVSEGKYILAQGQFITQTPLEQEEPFELLLSGTGIIKFNTFPYRFQAIDWVRSMQPLPRGCKRIRLSGSAAFSLIIPRPGQCVLVETERDSKRQMFTLEAGPTTTLAFDIEYGSIAVHLATQESGIYFDTFCCSSNIAISSTMGVSIAALRHYNPFSLCFLENTPLIPGDTFRLDVTGSGVSKNTGSYVRVCVAKQVTPHINQGQAQCLGTERHPHKRGKRLLVEHNVYKELFIRVTPTGLRVYRRTSTQVIDVVNTPVLRDHTLWFELHNVSLRVFKVSDFDSQDSQSTLLDNQYLLPSEDRPPPLPKRPPNLLAASRLASKQSGTRHGGNQRELVGICNEGYLTETSTDEEHTLNPPYSGTAYTSYVSADTWSPSARKNRATNAKFTVEPFSLSSGESDLRYDTYIDSAQPVYFGVDHFALSSMESLSMIYDHNFHQNQKMKCIPGSSHYEIPEPIWYKSKTKHNHVKTKENRENTAKDVKAGKDAPGCFNVKMSKRLFHNPKGKGSICQRQMVNNNCHSSSERCRMFTSLEESAGYSEEMSRIQICQEWVEVVNDLHHGRLNQNEGFLPEGRHVIENKKYSNNCHKCDGKDSKCLSKMEIHVSGDLEIPTSSVWLPESDDEDDGSVQHKLDISIVPVEGKLRCCSYHSDRRSNLCDSKVPLDYCENSPAVPPSNLNPPSKDGQTCNGIDDIAETTTDELSDRYSTHTDSDISPKDCGSCGFLVDDEDSQDNTTNDEFDDITQLKLLAHQDNGSHKPYNSATVHKNYMFNQDSSGNSPKLCKFQRVSDYFLAASVNPKEFKNQITDSETQSQDTKSQHSEHDSSDSEESVNSLDVSGENFTDNTEAVNLNDENGVENALSQELSVYDSCVASLRYHSGRSRRNITESVISNSSRATLMVGPTVTLPDAADNLSNSQTTIKRTETLKRNLNTSPSPSVRKVCGPKIV